MAKAISQNPALFEADELAPMPGKVEQQAFDIYNEIAERAGWTKATKLTPDRQKKLKRAVHEVGSLVEWKAALERGSRSTFLTTKFRPDLEFVTRLPKLLKISEGGFDDQRGADRPHSLSTQMQPQDEWGRFLRDYKLKGFWPTTLGPRPEDPQCRAPAAMLAACRERLGIVVAKPAAESREDRLRATIISYRKIGRWEDANRVERQLAAIEQRPPVEVPAPDARDPDVVPAQQPSRGGFWNPPSRADAVSRRMAAREQAQEVPLEYDDIPEGSNYEEQD